MKSVIEHRKMASTVAERCPVFHTLAVLTQQYDHTYMPKQTRVRKDVEALANTLPYPKKS